MYCVYKHTCPNGKVYIGITCCEAHERWKNGAGYKRNEHFYRAIQKYGWDNIKHEVLFDGLTKEDAENKEIELIATYSSNDKKHGYNCTNGGECAGKHTPETIEKIKERRKGKSHPHTHESKEKISCANKGRKHTPEAIEKMRQAKIGKKLSDETREKMSEAQRGEKAWLYGIPLSEETKEKIRNAHLGMKSSDEARKKMSESRKGKPTGRTGEKAPNSKPVMCVETGQIYSCAAEAGRALGLYSTSITAVVKGKLKTCGGYHWRYHNEQDEPQRKLTEK